MVDGVSISDYLLGIGYPFSAVEKILNDKKLMLYKEDSLLENIKSINNFFIKLGFTIKDLISMVEINAHLYSYKVETIVEKINYLNELGYELGQIYSMIKRSPQLCGLSIVNMNNKVALYKDIFPHKDVLKILYNSPGLFSFCIDSFEERKQTFIDIGYKEENVIKMFRIYPNLITYRKESILKALNRFISNGYSKSDAIRITTIRPVLISCFTYEFSRVYNYFNRLGFSNDDIRKMTVKEPTIFCCTENDFSIKINNLKEIGFSDDDIYKIIRVYPTIFTYDIFSIKTKINCIIECGYSKEEVINSITKMPSFIGTSIEGIKARLNYINKINLRDVFVLEPKHLIQSVEKTYARYEFLKAKGIDISMDNYIQLFIGESIFSKRYQISKEKLLEMFPMSKVSMDVDLVSFLKQFGYPEVYISRIMVYKDSIKYMIDYFLSLGFDSKQIVRITTKYTEIFECKDNIENVINILKYFGYSKDDIIDIITKYPNIVGLKESILKIVFDKINIIVNNKDTAKYILNKFPLLFSLDVNRIDLYLNIFYEYGYNYEQVIKMIIEYPNLFIINENTLNDRLEYLRKMNLLGIILLLPKLLSKNVELMYARFKYLESIGIDINMKNWKILIQHEILFSNNYGVTSDYLLKLLREDKKILKLENNS